MTKTIPTVLSTSQPAWECMGRKQSLPEPGECNWPDCGCDPHATKVIESLLEQGWTAALAATPAVGGELGWGQLVQLLLRAMDTSPKSENAAALAERMANAILAAPPASPLRGREINQADYKIGWWLSGALEDPNVCAEMKADINKWFEAHQPGLVMSASSASPPEQPAADPNDVEVVWLREIDAGTDNACWVPSNRVDPTAVAFVPLTPSRTGT